MVSSSNGKTPVIATSTAISTRSITQAQEGEAGTASVRDAGSHFGASSDARSPPPTGCFSTIAMNRLIAHIIRRPTCRSISSSGCGVDARQPAARNRRGRRRPQVPPSTSSTVRRSGALLGNAARPRAAFRGVLHYQGSELHRAPDQLLAGGAQGVQARARTDAGHHVLRARDRRSRFRAAIAAFCARERADVARGRRARRSGESVHET